MSRLLLQEPFWLEVAGVIRQQNPRKGFLEHVALHQVQAIAFQAGLNGLDLEIDQLFSVATCACSFCRAAQVGRKEERQVNGAPKDGLQYEAVILVVPQEHPVSAPGVAQHSVHSCRHGLVKASLACMCCSQGGDHRVRSLLSRNHVVPPSCPPRWAVCCYARIRVSTQKAAAGAA